MLCRYEARLPELEGEKKIAVAAKNFKEASKVAAEMKNITAQKEAAVESQKQSEAGLGPANEELKEAQARSEGIKGVWALMALRTLTAPQALKALMALRTPRALRARRHAHHCM